MIVPPYLKTGDTIAVVAPARKISTAELEPALEILHREGFQVQEGRYLRGSHNQFSGTDQERLHDLLAALNDVKVKAILCARGGYGCMRILDQFPAGIFRAQPKWLIGFSDITVLHDKINREAGVCSIHGPMAINFAQSTDVTRQLLDLIKGKKMALPPAADHPLNLIGKASGILTGGNLSMLYALNGSIPTGTNEGKVIFMEDLDEYLYHIDRMLISLKRAGYFKGCAGVLVGALSDMNDNKVPFGKTAEEIVHEHLAELEIPVGFGFNAGHIPENHPLIFGNTIEMDCRKDGTFLNYLS